MLQPEIVTKIDPQPMPALGRQRKVLVIDDNKSVREALSRSLVARGYNVTLACNGFHGGLLFCTTEYDLVIIDLQVPQMNVWELSLIFKHHSPKTPVIMVAEVSEDRHWGDLSTSSVDAIISRPFTLRKVETTVEKLLVSWRK